MNIETIPLNQLETNVRRTLSDCADSGNLLVVELPDQRLIAIQSLEAIDDDSLIDDLLQANPSFRSLVQRSKAGPRKPFSTQWKT